VNLWQFLSAKNAALKKIVGVTLKNVQSAAGQ